MTKWVGIHPAATARGTTVEGNEWKESERRNQSRKS
jgi:hypothetical protein